MCYDMSREYKMLQSVKYSLFLMLQKSKVQSMYYLHARVICIE